MEVLWRNRRRSEPLDLDVLLTVAARQLPETASLWVVLQSQWMWPAAHAVSGVQHSAAVFLMAAQLFLMAEQTSWDQHRWPMPFLIRARHQLLAIVGTDHQLSTLLR